MVTRVSQCHICWLSARPPQVALQHVALAFRAVVGLDRKLKLLKARISPRTANELCLKKKVFAVRALRTHKEHTTVWSTYCGSFLPCLTVVVGEEGLWRRGIKETAMAMTSCWVISDYQVCRKLPSSGWQKLKQNTSQIYVVTAQPKTIDTAPFLPLTKIGRRHYSRAANHRQTTLLVCICFTVRSAATSFSRPYVVSTSIKNPDLCSGWARNARISTVVME